jgi:hypothetical protein
MHIVVEKIITLYKKDSDGNVIKSPANDNRPVVEGLKTVIETIPFVWMRLKLQGHGLNLRFKKNLYLGQSHQSICWILIGIKEEILREDLLRFI